jgi:plasmid maintenance system antidote protein VapI
MKDEILIQLYEDRNISIKDLCEYTGYSRQHISAIIHGRAKISKKLAKIIERLINEIS